jgi:hypothetical protein
METKDTPEVQENRTAKENLTFGRAGERSMQGRVETPSETKEKVVEPLAFNEITQEQVEQKLGRKSLWKDEAGNNIEPKGKEGRGADYEKLKDANIDNTFKTIDDYDAKSRTATSLKTIDLNRGSYQKDPGRVEDKINGYTDELAAYTDTTSTQNGRRIRVLKEEIDHYNLSVGVPKGSCVGEHLEKLKDCNTYARQKGVNLILDEVP